MGELVSTALAPAPTNKPKPVTREYNRVDVNKAIELRMKKHLSYQQIADLLGVKKQSVYNRLKAFEQVMADPDIGTQYIAHETTFLHQMEGRLALSLADEQAIKDASLNNRAYAFSAINKARLLHEGRATDITDVRAITASLSQLEEREERLKSQLMTLEVGEEAPEPSQY